jgi:hypothetical protein
VADHGPAGRPPFLGGYALFVPAHFIFAIGEEFLFLFFMTPIQERLAQEWQLLWSNAIPAGQGSVDSYNHGSSRLVHPDAVEGKNAEIHFLCESVENELCLGSTDH